MQQVAHAEWLHGGIGQHLDARHQLRQRDAGSRGGSQVQRRAVGPRRRLQGVEQPREIRLAQQVERGRACSRAAGGRVRRIHGEQADERALLRAAGGGALRRQHRELRRRHQLQHRLGIGAQHAPRLAARPGAQHGGLQFHRQGARAAARQAVQAQCAAAIPRRAAVAADAELRADGGGKAHGNGEAEDAQVDLDAQADAHRGRHGQGDGAVGFVADLHRHGDIDEQRSADDLQVHFTVQHADHAERARQLEVAAFLYAAGRAGVGQRDGVAAVIRVVGGDHAFDDAEHGQREAGFQRSLDEVVAQAQLQAQAEDDDGIEIPEIGFRHLRRRRARQLAEIYAARAQHWHAVDDGAEAERARKVHIVGKADVDQEIAIRVDLDAYHRQHHADGAEVQVAYAVGEGEVDLEQAHVVADLLVQDIDHQAGQAAHLGAAQGQAQAVQVGIVEDDLYVDGPHAGCLQHAEMRGDQPVAVRLVIRLALHAAARVDGIVLARGGRHAGQCVDDGLGRAEVGRAVDGHALAQHQQEDLEIAGTGARHAGHLFHVLSLVRVQQVAHAAFEQWRHGGVQRQGHLAVRIALEDDAADDDKAEVER
ncbi:hypothetical protein D3C87_1019460 [compost metagenome]